MHLIGIEVSLHFYHAPSLKEKRRIVNSILDTTRHKYEISTAEVKDHDSLVRGSLGFGLVTNSLKHGDAVLQKVINYLDIQSEVEITNIDWLEI